MGAQLDALSQACEVDLLRHGTVSDADTIRDTAVAQPLIVGAGLICLQALADTAAVAGVTAGHSVGEITAATVAGVFQPAEAMRFVGIRGRAMAEASALTPTGMSAVIGGDPAAVEQAFAAAGVSAANVNGAGQVVAAGSLDNLAALSAAPPARARVIALQVAGAFHTEYMRPAVAPLSAAAELLSPPDPTIRLLSNADGQVVGSGSQAVRRLVDQVCRPVRWDLCMATLAELGTTAVIELAPAGTLVNLIKRTLKGVPTLALRSPDDLAAAAALAAEHGRP